MSKMSKRIFGILICMLFLILPTIQGTSNTLDEKTPSTKTKDNFHYVFVFYLFYGIIEYNGIVSDEYYGNYYNITPIMVRYKFIGYESGFGFQTQSGKITTQDMEYLYLPKDDVNWHGFVSKHIMFLRTCYWMI